MIVAATANGGTITGLVMQPGAVGDLGPLPDAPEGLIAAAW
jgi:hypothetical protein